MPKRPTRTYTPEEKAAALELYPKVGPAEAGRQLKINPNTITSWARAAGLKLNDPPLHLEKSRNIARLTKETRKEEALALLYEVAVRSLERTREQEIAYKGNQATQVVFSEMSPESVKQLTEAATKALDKALLMSGEATSRTETVAKEDFELALSEWANEYSASQRAEQENRK